MQLENHVVNNPTSWRTTYLKFPPQTSLPSVAELKARFARFGPMDQSGFRIFWKSSTCHVVFLYKADAQAAFKFSAANPSLFGSTGVRCILREFGDSASEAPETTQNQVQNQSCDPNRNRFWNLHHFHCSKNMAISQNCRNFKDIPNSELGQKRLEES